MTKAASLQFCGLIGSFGHRDSKVNIVQFANVCIHILQKDLYELL